MNILAATFLIAGATATTTMAQRVSLGVEAGINLANLANQYEGETVSGQIKVGFNGGLFANIPVSRNLSIQPGVKYSLKGSQYTRNTDSAGSTLLGGISHYESKNKLSLHYVEIPVNFVYTFGKEGSPSKFFVGAGPYVSFLVNAQERYKLKETLSNGQTADDVNGIANLEIGNNTGFDNLKRTDYGAQAFIGYKLNNNWFVKAGGQAGFQEIRYDKVEPNVSSSNPKNKIGTQSFQKNNYLFFLDIGYMFGTKSKTAPN